MRLGRWGPIIAGVAALLLGACGGGGDGGGATNTAPIANAGAAQTATSGTSVSLNGTASSDPDGSITAFSWTQTAGTAVSLNSTTTSQPFFVAPQAASVSTLIFRLTVTDNDGATHSATVNVTVNPSLAADAVTGIVRFARVPFGTTAPVGLDYANPVLQPSRGVIVKAYHATTSAELASVTTDASGAYSFTVPANTTVFIQVLAHMQRGGMPRWNVRVQNGSSGNAPYAYSTTAFSSSLGTRNIDIPSGIPANGSSTALANRQSGPFAILDTIYAAMQPILVEAPSSIFPELIVDWGVQTAGTQFVVSGTRQTIQLLSNITEDADEFDQHVVAHEYGHYIENSFSRSDSIGGAHGPGDRLDMRVAFGEGFGTAFAAMVLNDPVYRDSFVSSGQQVSSSSNIESNPGPGSGCWCSESSTSSILWDLYDGNNISDVSDRVTLGFAPIWAALTGAHRATPAFTSIFSFITALKEARPGSAAAINSLVAAQNINSAGINDFASNETNAPYPNMLPLYAVVTRGVPVVVRSINDGGYFNGAGSRALLRFTSDVSARVTMTSTTSNPSPNADPDFHVFRNGATVRVGETTAVRTETQSFTAVDGADYAIDTYDCANVCSENSPTAGDYNLTVTIN